VYDTTTVLPESASVFPLSIKINCIDCIDCITLLLPQFIEITGIKAIGTYAHHYTHQR
jgi:hypothetical protein